LHRSPTTDMLDTDMLNENDTYRLPVHLSDNGIMMFLLQSPGKYRRQQQQQHLTVTMVIRCRSILCGNSTVLTDLAINVRLSAAVAT